MDGKTIGTLAEYIAECRRGDRHYNGATKQPGFDTTVSQDVAWDQGSRSGDGGCSQNDSGQSGNNICRRYKGTSK